MGKGDLRETNEPAPSRDPLAGFRHEALSSQREAESVMADDVAAAHQRFAVLALAAASSLHG